MPGRIKPRRRQVLTRKLRAFLDDRPRIARLATVGRDGYPHVVTIWFARDGDDIVFGCERTDQKARNVLRDPRATVIIGGDPKNDEAGYMIQGDASLEDDSDRRLTALIVRRYEKKRSADQLLAEAGWHPTIIRLRPRRVIRVWWQ
jgi:PPOX class probable F420-dependent enzyme